MGHVWAIIVMTPISSIGEKGDACTYLRGDHFANNDSKGRSRSHVTMIKGTMMSVSKKLRGVTTSSTKKEVVSNGEKFIKCAWFQHFCLVQGDGTKEDLLIQDYESCMIFHKNCRFSIEKGRNNENVKYLFVVGRTEKKETKITCYSTEKMIADCSSKPT